ncbi:MAG: hypothetical protein NC114_11435 [Ruminococcus flavefaciens]|nr:hypothetical protein [Ruminococcus flavefaciens]
MNYRQWKKRYKKLHGVNPPLELDKRKQRRIAKRAIRNISSVDFGAAVARAAEGLTDFLASFMRAAAGVFDATGTACRNTADNMQPIEIKGRVFSWQVREFGTNHYAVYEINALGGADELRAITYSQKAAEKIAEILESDHLEHTKQTSPERIQSRSGIADSLRAAVVTAYESGVIQ